MIQLLISNGVKCNFYRAVPNEYLFGTETVSEHLNPFNSFELVWYGGMKNGDESLKKKESSRNLILLISLVS